MRAGDVKPLLFGKRGLLLRLSGLLARLLVHLVERRERAFQIVQRARVGAQIGFVEVPIFRHVDCAAAVGLLRRAAHVHEDAQRVVAQAVREALARNPGVVAAQRAADHGGNVPGVQVKARRVGAGEGKGVVFGLLVHPDGARRVKAHHDLRALRGADVVIDGLPGLLVQLVAAALLHVLRNGAHGVSGQVHAARRGSLLLLLCLLRRGRPLNLGGFQRRCDGFLRFLRSSGSRCRRRGGRPLHLCGRFLRLRCLRRRRFLRGLRRRLRHRRGGRRQGADGRRRLRRLLRVRLCTALFFPAEDAPDGFANGGKELDESAGFCGFFAFAVRSFPGGIVCLNGLSQLVNAGGLHARLRPVRLFERIRIPVFLYIRQVRALNSVI